MKSERDTTAREMLEASKLYCTKGRMAILGVLIDSARPLKQDEIATQVSRTGINRVTIYRTLSALLEAGLVHRAYLQKRAWHFELADRCTKTQCHPHFTCTMCGATHCLTKMRLPAIHGSHEGFFIQRQQVRFEGLCPKCSCKQCRANKKVQM